MPEIEFGDIAQIHFTQGEIKYFKDIAFIIQNKKGEGHKIYDRQTSEMGEASVDLIMELADLGRFWSRGRYHFDFLVGDYKLEVKTRKYYANSFFDLDVRLDLREYKKAQEANIFVPVVYQDLEQHGAKILSPGVLYLEHFVEATEKFKSKIPRSRSLREPCFRAPWKIVFEYANDFGFMYWKEFVDLCN